MGRPFYTTNLKNHTTLFALKKKKTIVLFWNCVVLCNSILKNITIIYLKTFCFLNLIQQQKFPKETYVIGVFYGFSK